MIRLQNNLQGMILHYPTYRRLLKFSQTYCPEQPGDIVVKGWLSRIYADDPSVHILMDLEDDATLSGHAVIEVQRAYAGHIVIVHQLEHDKPSLERLDEGYEYVEKLAASIPAHSLIWFVTEHTKALQRRYNFEVSRTMMIKRYENFTQVSPKSN